MFLKSLTLKGFKSFAESTTLEFEPGVTVVVGPNGSGKSNLVDAVAWVLGAQGPRTLRSGKMEDVIFAGSRKRPALGRAEVSLTIDNQAGLLPIDFAEVTVTRTLFRSGDSEYAINGAPCRLFDVQELLSDTGVGRQQHVIVSQGQLDAVLNARPEDRRLIIEEAAGVLKYRRRKERAERRLESTEASLVRLQDLLREVRRQLRPLERQADAARRHQDLTGELQAIRRHLAGRELGVIESRLTSGRAIRADLARVEADVRARLRELDADVIAREAELSALRSDADATDLADALSTAESLRAKAKGLSGVLTERRRLLSRDRDAAVDESLVASLEAEAVRLADDIAAVGRARADLRPEADELSQAERSLGEDVEAFEQAYSAIGPTASGRVEELRAELGARKHGIDRGQSELRRLDGLLNASAQRISRRDGEMAELTQAKAEAARDEADLASRLDGAERSADAAERVVLEAEAALRRHEAEHHRWTARVEALTLALERANAQVGVDRLAEVDGVVGRLVELVDVDAGWEAAFEAAVGESIASIVVEDVIAARRSLQHLKDGDALGVILPLLGHDGLETPVVVATERGVESAELVRSHVRSSHRRVDALLDRLLPDSVVAVTGTWIDAVDLTVSRPDLTVVTREGDRFAATGWRPKASVLASTRARLGEAERRAAEEAELVERQGSELGRAKDLAARDRAMVAELARDLAGVRARLTAVEDAWPRLQRDLEDTISEREALSAQRGEVAERLGRDEHQASQLQHELPTLEASAAAEARRAQDERAGRSRLAERAAGIANRRRELEVQLAGIEERRALLLSRRAEVEERLRRHAVERAEVAAKRNRVEALLTTTDRLSALVDSRVAQLDRVVDRLRQARRQEAETLRELSHRLEQLRHEQATAERELAEVRERASRTELEEAEARVRLETLVDNVRREFDCEPEGVRDAPCPPLPASTSPANRVRELERELRLMGPINPLALEEHVALQERHTFLEGQLEDVRSARRELTKVIRAVDAEIVDVFRAAYADTADNFERLFTTLFPGGQGRLRLTDPDRLLETGIDVEARPSGKNVRRLSLLSGGERSLTALAFLFAVFRSRPSPFYLMDEVEAALDDVNLHRFLDLMHEFRDEAQLVVVSHQKRTMEAADCLYGVTMQPGGSSRVVSERVTARA